MKLYGTCTGCGGLLHVTDDDDIAHPGCTEVFTRAQLLAQDWLIAACHNDVGEELRIEMLLEEMDTAAPQFKNAALAYAAWNWPVFPLKHHSKVPACRHGFKDATTDPERIGRWWDQHPGDNIGLATGHLFDVIDVDVPLGIHSYLELLALEAAGKKPFPDAHGRVVTASGGFHLYVVHTNIGNKAGMRPGIDYRGLGGYVCAPPSTLGGRGHAWAWTSKPSPLIVGAR